MNEIYLRRRSKVLLPERDGECPPEIVASLVREVERLGFLFDRDVVAELRLRSVEQVERFHRQFTKMLRERVGAHRDLDPLYPNFPQQVMEMHEAELYLNAFFHYLTLERPEYDVLEREPLDEVGRRQLVRLGDRKDFEAMFVELLESATPFSEADKDDVEWLVAQYRNDVKRLLPTEMRCKENIAHLGAQLVRSTSFSEEALEKYLKTATDLLRLAVALNDGDVSLAMPGRFGKFYRSERNFFLRMLERAPNRTEDMLRFRQRWIRLGERLHPGEYAGRYPKTAAAFDVLRNDLPFETFNGRIAAAVKEKKFSTAIEALADRPGELARRLDHFARSGANVEELETAFHRVADKVSSPVLLQAMSHFRTRNPAPPYRTFFPKGTVAKAFATSKALPPLSADVARSFAEICERALVERFAKLSPLGRCYIDPRLKDYMAPFSQRSASKALRTVSRGSRLPLPDCKVLRFFVWWKNGKSRVDVDLSAALFGDDFRHHDTLAYYNLKGYGGCHSGDIVDAPEGAAEFIDVDLDRCREVGVRYVMMCLNSFTAQPYCDLPECFAGWMARREAGSGEIFEPKTVFDKVDIAANTRICLPAAFDLVDRSVIWMDVACSDYPQFVNNVHNNLGTVSVMLRALAQIKKTDLYTLFALHAKARGRQVESKMGAETVFAVDAGITPFDIPRITSEFL